MLPLFASGSARRPASTTIAPLIATPIRPAVPSSGLKPSLKPDSHSDNMPRPAESTATSATIAADTTLRKDITSVASISISSTGR